MELLGGTPLQCTYAASTVLMNMLGLVCDPVGGLVEYPCQNRNAAGVSNALIAAEMSLAGITQFIPLDEMIDAMYTVGKSFLQSFVKLLSAVVQPHRLPVRSVIFAADQQSITHNKQSPTEMTQTTKRRIPELLFPGILRFLFYKS